MNPSSQPGCANEWLQYLDTLDWSPGHRDLSGHNAFLRAATLGQNPESAVAAVASRIKASGGSYSASKLQSQIRRAYDFVRGGPISTSALVSSPLLTFDAHKLLDLAAKIEPVTREDLKNASPVSLTETDSAAFLDVLYKPGERILIFTDYYSQGEVLFQVGSPNATLPKLTAEGAWYLVNPINGQSYPNPRQENKLSRRSEESVTSWRYLVLESDIAPENQWLSCLVQLPLKIAAIYSSGGKSVHALVRVDARSKSEWDTIALQFKQILVPLGADQAAMTGVRLSRLPGVKRGTRLQELLYLNPNPSGNPIFKSKP
jgi:hypothetical protein